jgi:hypothetical protein
LDSFEFVQIPISIVLGIAISEILAGWGHQLRRRNEQNYSALQNVACAYVLMWAFRYLWVQWAIQPDAWDYGTYLFAAAPAIVLALAAYVIRFDPTLREHDQRSQYEQSRRPVCVLLALFPVVMVARIVYQRGGFQFQHPMILPLLFLTTLAFAWLAVSSRPRDQWIGWSLAWAIQLVLFASINATLTLAPL